jgi:hypothetical protein
VAEFLAGVLVGYWIAIVVVEVNLWVHRHG